MGRSAIQLEQEDQEERQVLKKDFAPWSYLCWIEWLLWKEMAVACCQCLLQHWLHNLSAELQKLLTSEHTATCNSYSYYARESAVAVNVGQGWPTGDLVMSVNEYHFLRCTSQKLFKGAMAEFLFVRRNILPDIEKLWI